MSVEADIFFNPDEDKWESVRVSRLACSMKETVFVPIVKRERYKLK